jgi:tetratricopeptide (TPR) repeat protein
VAACGDPTQEGARSEGAAVRLGIEIEAQSLLDAIASTRKSEVPASVRVELYVYVMTRKGEIVDSRSLWVRLPLPDLVSRLPGAGVLLVEDFDLQAGEYQLRTLVRDADSQQFAIRILDLTVPAENDPSPSLSRPAFSRNAASWITASGEPNESDFPSALPVLRPGVPAEFSLRGCNLGSFTPTVRLLNGNGEPLPDAHVNSEAVSSDGNDREVRVGIEVGTVPPGLYRLEATVTSNSATVITTLPVFVTKASGAPAAWTALGALSAGPEPLDEAIDVESAGSASKKIAIMETEYLRALDRLASGRLDDAVTILAKLGQSALLAHDNPRKSTKWLTEAQNRVTARLLDHDPECMLPLLQLHLELHGRYVDSNNTASQLLQATRTRIRSLAEVYATDAKQEMAPGLAADSLVELATELERSGYLTSALIVLREALALDHQNTDVILDLAYQYEHHRFHSEALDLLRRLLELEPRSDEGRLRTAILFLRLGNGSEAIDLLRQLVSDARSEWVLAVAYQELAHDLLRKQQFDQAVALLEQAVRRLPQIQRLRIELSYALDRVGRRQQAREVVSNLKSGVGGPSPRLNYRVPDRRNEQRSRAEFRRHSTARLPLLAAAIDASGGSR